jgi:hypothetical protein
MTRLVPVSNLSNITKSDIYGALRDDHLGTIAVLIPQIIDLGVITVRELLEMMGISVGGSKETKKGIVRLIGPMANQELLTDIMVGNFRKYKPEWLSRGHL